MVTFQLHGTGQICQLTGDNEDHGNLSWLLCQEVSYYCKSDHHHVNCSEENEKDTDHLMEMVTRVKLILEKRFSVLPILNLVVPDYWIVDRI